jgi:hypothetical protein
MLRDDLEAAITAVREGGWGDRRPAFQFYVGHAQARPLVAEFDGAIVGTAVATWSGRVGWVGLVFVAPSMRGRGLGAELTRATMDCLEESGCRSFLLAASALGRPIYDRLGFRVEGHYVAFSGPRRVDPLVDPRVRHLRPGDLDAVCALDRAATDEDRSHLVRAVADGWVIDDVGTVRGFALRTPWGLGPAVAGDAADGALLLEVLRTKAPTNDMTLTIPDANTAAAEYVHSLGFAERERLPRMLLGEPVAWQPQHIWTISSYMMG